MPQHIIPPWIFFPQLLRAILSCQVIHRQQVEFGLWAIMYPPLLQNIQQSASGLREKPTYAGSEVIDKRLDGSLPTTQPPSGTYEKPCRDAVGNTLLILRKGSK